MRVSVADCQQCRSTPGAETMLLRFDTHNANVIKRSATAYRLLGQAAAGAQASERGQQSGRHAVVAPQLTVPPITLGGTRTLSPA
jgi:hypothetical protein